MILRFLQKGLLVAGLTLLGVAVPLASATTITLGAAANYAILAGPYVNSFTMNSVTINGGVAVGSNGSLLWNGPTINGSVWEASGVSGTNSAHVSGTTTTNYNLSTAISNAQTAESTAAGLTATTTVSGGAINVTSSSTDVTVNATGAQTVLDVSSMSINNGSLTLNGTSGDVFIINVTGTGGISFQNTANIVLTGGLTAYNVLFNVEATNATVSLQASSSSVFNGTILALNSGATLNNGGTLNGAVIAAFGSSSTSYGITSQGGFTVNYEGFGDPPVPEPATLSLFALGVGGLLTARKFKKTSADPDEASVKRTL
jgi:hypothetical protein